MYSIIPPSVCNAASKKDPGKTTTKGYEPLDQSEGADANHATDSDAEESGMESSDFADSDSEYGVSYVWHRIQLFNLFYPN